jgi:hypothetical protein
MKMHSSGDFNHLSGIITECKFTIVLHKSTEGKSDHLMFDRKWYTSDETAQWNK